MKLVSLLVSMIIFISCSGSSGGGSSKGNGNPGGSTDRDTIIQEVSQTEEKLKAYGVYFKETEEVIGQSGDEYLTRTKIVFGQEQSDEQLTQAGISVADKDALLEDMASLYTEANKILTQGEGDDFALNKIIVALYGHVYVKLDKMFMELRVINDEPALNLPLLKFEPYYDVGFLDPEIPLALEKSTYIEVFDHYEVMEKISTRFRTYYTSFSGTLEEFLKNEIALGDKKPEIELKRLISDLDIVERMGRFKAITADEMKMVKLLKLEVGESSDQTVKSDDIRAVNTIAQKKVVKKKLAEIRKIILEFNSKYNLSYVDVQDTEYDAQSVLDAVKKYEDMSEVHSVQSKLAEDEIEDLEVFLGSTRLEEMADDRINKSFKRVKKQVKTFRYSIIFPM